MFEAQPQPADFPGRAERDAERGQGAALHLQACDRTILDLDGVDAGCGARKHGGNVTHQVCEQVVGVDGMGQQRAAQFGLPATAPRHRIVLGAALPRRLHRREIRLAGEAELDDAFGLLQPVAVAILKDRQQAPLGGGELVNFCE